MAEREPAYTNCVASSATTILMRWVRQSNPTGKSLLVFRSRVKPKNQKYFCFLMTQITSHHRHPVPRRGALAIVTNVGQGAVDAGSADDERRESVRQRRVVLTPRCWRQVCGSSPADDGGKKAGHRGDHVISRKAIAQGMSDVLRCPRTLRAHCA